MEKIIPSASQVRNKWFHPTIANGHNLGTRLLIRLFRMQEKTEKHLAQSRRSAKYSNSTFLAWGILYEYRFNAYNFLLLYV
jgi:hypothetical protein